MNQKRKNMAQDPELQPTEAPQHSAGGHIMLMGILVLAPFALLIAKLGEFGLPFPYWDAWRFVDVLQKADAGTLGFVDLWAQHNEHRILFPKLLMLVLAQLSGWNVWWEIGASVFFALLMFVALVVMLLRAVGTDTTLRCTGAALISALLFSWTQSESWVWGFQSNAWLCLAAVVLGVAALASRLRFPVRIGLGVLCGIVATYSYANGLFIWFAALPLLWDLRPARAARIGGAIVWCATAALVAQSYFFGYVQPGVSPSLLTAFEHPALFVQFLAAMLGAPVTTFLTEPAWHGVNVAVPLWAMLPGPVAVALFLFLAWRSWRAERDFAVLAPWLTLAAFALGSALVASAGRSGLGLGQALTSRYIPITSLFWFALIALWLRALARSPWWDDARTRSIVVGGCAVAILGGLAGASTTSAAHEQRCHWKQMGWLAIRLDMPEAIFLRDLSDTPEVFVTTILPWLKETRRCGLDTPLPDPKQYAPLFAQDAEQLIAMGLIPPAKVYLDVAVRLDPELPEAIVLRAKLPQ